LERVSPAALSIDQRLEILCWLLMVETEDHCPQGPIYFEALARALVVSLLRRVREAQDPASPYDLHVLSAIRFAIRRLENDFRKHISVTELADQAHLSVDHFVRTFRKVAGSTPHQGLSETR
jgi:AraC family transcriptional regulator